MKHLMVMFLLVPIIAYGQTALIEEQSRKMEQIEKQVGESLDQLSVFVEVAGKKVLQRVINKRWPENIQTTFNVLKDSQGRIIYIGEFPTSESGDWNLELRHYFDENGKLIAFTKRLAFFSEECTDNAVVENTVELYDGNFKIIHATKNLTDNEGKSLDEQRCSDPYNWTFDKRPTASALAELKRIPQ